MNSGLVLTRREGERIFIGDSITIVVREIRNGQVRLVIDAPRDVKVMREELIEGNTLREAQG